MLAVRFGDSLEPNLLGGMGPLEAQRAIETTVLQVAGDLNLAEALALSGNVNRVASQGTRDLNMLRTAPLIDLQNTCCPGSFNLQLQLGADKIPRPLFDPHV